MMKFDVCDPKKGDIVRVLIRDKYYHYGIYVGDDRVIEFGSKRDVLSASKDEVMVKEVSVSEFLDGGHLEVSIYSFIDNIKRNKPKKIVELARGRLGEKGYDLKDNNCEHFCNEVTFNKHYSSMSDEYFKK